MRRRLTVRLRLTLLYGGLFLATGAALLAINYTLLRANLPDRQVQAKTGQDVIDFVRKALTDPGLSPADRTLAGKIVSGSPADAAAIAACSTVSRPLSPASGASWPTPPTSCVPR
jgi:hypothetical protein